MLETGIAGTAETTVTEANTARTRGSGTLSGPFPELAPGSNAVSFSGGITAVSIVPRWFMI